MAKNNAAIWDVSTLLQAGINPKTGLPLKVDDGCGCNYKADLRKVLRVIDEQDAINRYTWYNLPPGLDSQLIERILYYKGQAAFFYIEKLNRFFFLPYALSGTIDVYGRFNQVTPLPFGGGKTDDNKANAKSSVDMFLANIVLDVVKEVPEELDAEILTKGCVLLHDYCKQISQTNIARSLLNDPILELMAEAYPMARTAIIASSGVKGMRVNDQDQQANVKAASRSVTRAAMEGDPWIPIIGNLDFQDLTSNGSALKAQDFLLYMQSLDNFRLKTYGLDNGGIFEKSAHTLESEQTMNMGGSQSRVYQDGLTLRQQFCDIVNAIWDIGIWCDISESAQGDINMDGMPVDEKDQSGAMTGDQPQGAQDDM